MFKTTICRICLRTDIETRDDVDEELVNFHDEISDYSVFFRQGLEYCSICEHLLRKFFTFYKKCRLANEILQCYKKNRKALFPSNLHKKLPPTSLGIHNPDCLYKFEHDSDRDETDNNDNDANDDDSTFEHTYRSIKKEEDEEKDSINELNESIDDLNESINDLNENNSETLDSYDEDPIHESSDECIQNVSSPPTEQIIQLDDHDSNNFGSDLLTKEYLMDDGTNGEINQIKYDKPAVEISDSKQVNQQDRKDLNNCWPMACMTNQQASQHSKAEVTIISDIKIQLDKHDSNEFESDLLTEEYLIEDGKNGEVNEIKYDKPDIEISDSKQVNINNQNKSWPLACMTNKKANQHSKTEMNFLEIKPIPSVVDDDSDMQNDAREIISVTRKQVKLILKDNKNIYIDTDIERSPFASNSKNINIDVDDECCPAVSKKSGRKPASDMKEFEKVFDIERFATRQEAKDEIARRKTSEWYLSAKHKCEICFMVFRSEKCVEYHKRWHDKSAGKYVCKTCLMRYPTRKAATQHGIGAHFGKFTCKMCPLITYQKWTVKPHFLMHEGTIFTCEICSHTFKHENTFKNHQRYAHETAFICVTCARTFVSKAGLVQHRKYIHKAGSLTDSDATARCEPCGLTFANEQVYTVHVLNTKEHQQLASAIIGCKKCGAKFEDVDSLAEHNSKMHVVKQIRRRPGGSLRQLFPPASSFKCSLTDSLTDSDVPTVCEVCGVTFPSNQQYTVHVINTDEHQQLASDIIGCNNCGARFEDKDSLKAHKLKQSRKIRRRALAEKNKLNKESLLESLLNKVSTPGKNKYKASYSCSLCGTKVSSLLRGSFHLRDHHPDSEYSRDLLQRKHHMCDVCGKCFFVFSHLRDHLNTHNGLKPFACKHCPARFSTRMGIYLHEVRHKPPKCECEVCGKKFVTSSGLYNHMRSHIQDRRYKCLVCTKGFIHSSALYEHVRYVHNRERRVRKPRGAPRAGRTDADGPSTDPSTKPRGIPRAVVVTGGTSTDRSTKPRAAGAGGASTDPSTKPRGRAHSACAGGASTNPSIKTRDRASTAGAGGSSTNPSTKPRGVALAIPRGVARAVTRFMVRAVPRAVVPPCVSGVPPAGGAGGASTDPSTKPPTVVIVNTER